MQLLQDLDRFLGTTGPDIKAITAGPNQSNHQTQSGGFLLLFEPEEITKFRSQDKHWDGPERCVAR